MFLSQWRWLVRIQCHIRVASSSFYLWLYAFVWPTQLVSRVLSPSVSFHAHMCFWKPLAELTWGRGQCSFTYLLITWNLVPDHAKWRKWAWKETHIGKNSQIRQMDPGRHRKKKTTKLKGNKIIIIIFSHHINVPLVSTKPALNLTAKLWVVLVCLEPDQIKFQLVFSSCGFKSKVIPLWSFNAATLQTNITGKKRQHQ